MHNKGCHFRLILGEQNAYVASSIVSIMRLSLAFCAYDRFVIPMKG